MSDALGLWLRRARETQQLTLEDVEKALRIRRRYLQALEVSDYAALPGEIQARGFLRNYARFLNISVEEALARYDAEIQGLPVQPRSHAAPKDVRPPAVERPSRFPPPPSQEEEIASMRRGIPQGVLLILLGALIFFLVVALGSFIWLQFFSQPDTTVQTPQPTAVATMLTPAVEEASSVAPVFPLSADGKIRVRLVANEHAWISISADENIVFQGIAEPNVPLEAEAGELLIVATGNGGAFQLYVNGTDWGLLGEQGEVVRRVWGPQGETSLEEF